MLSGRLDDADRLAAEALAGFEEAAIPYDVAHGWITQARVRRARGDERGWLELVDRARRRIESEGFGSLYARCPEIRLPAADRIGAALTAFAAGDALGVPWEGGTPVTVDRDAVASIPAARWGWPRGSTSDDTAQVMLVAELLADTEGRPTPEEFMARLAAVADEIRGLGPTTRAALAEFTATGRIPAPDPGRRPTNGAAMRMLPVGWVTPATDADLRRRRVEALAVGTHQAPVAIGAAQVIAAMGAWAVEGVERDTILAAAEEEVAWVGRRDAELSAVQAALAGRWRPPEQGVGLDADETVAAVVHVVRAADDLGSALLQAVYLGGDTDTVAAMVGGILGAAAPEQVPALPWLALVDYEPPSGLAGRLADLRRAWYVR
ncbi:MAG: ADP-ribosylglycohydrolase family protein [Frankia sp.]|nr:ADP-ribosylglycohydrolase family protein [Frankia sp.]